MSACTWIVVLVMMGQVGGRYGGGGNTNPFDQGAPANSGSAPANSNSPLVPITESSAQGVGALQGTLPASPSNNRSASPYGNPGVTPLGASSPFPPSATANPSTPAASNSPWQTSNAASNNTSQSDAVGGLKPAAMMRAMLLAVPAGSRLPGTPISLADAVATASSRAEQTERVEAYWDLCSSVADYYLGVREQSELAQARRSRSGTTWQQAEAELASRVATSQAAAVASQYRLASLMGLAGAMPLPADIPHCGDYHTRYEQIFAGRPSAEAQQLAALLPKRYAELKDAGAAVTRTQDWLNSTAARDNGDGVETVRALELLALRRRAFVQIARDYNRRIARYTELSTPGDVASDRLIGMLIKSTTSTATRNSSPIPFNRQSQNAPSLPRTFSELEEGWTPASGEKIGEAAIDEAIRQAAGESETVELLDQEPRQERSLLVKPQ